MNCGDAEKYIMKYMDGEMTTAEAELLQMHLSGCPVCTAAFQIYDHMLTEFDDFVLVEAPEGFESAVMAKITQLPDCTFEVAYDVRSRVWGNVFGGFTVLFGTGAIVAFFRQPILQSLSQMPYIGSHIQALVPVEQEITLQMELVSGMVNDSFSFMNQVLSNATGIIFLMLSLVCFVQYYMIRRKKKKSLVERK